MRQVPSTQALLDACSILFGPDIPPTIDFLKYLRLSGIKAAYRKKALETHPDRLNPQHVNPASINDGFINATRAYRTLTAAIENNGLFLSDDAPKQARHRRDSPRRNKTHPADERDRWFRGGFPKRRLLFGQFLFYSRLISWEMLIKAILWQKRQNPKIGQIACTWGMLSRTDIQVILARRRMQEKFGQSAVRNGYLTDYNILALLGKQRMLNRAIGIYFLNTGHLTHLQIEELARRQRLHNQRFSR